MAPKRDLPVWPMSVFEFDRIKASEHIGEFAATKLLKYVVTYGRDLEDLASVPYNKLCIAPRVAEFVQSNCRVFSTRIVSKLESARGDTIKLLLELRDGHRVETVIMKHANRSTVCVSSQIGCQMGCKFCATGTLGIIGNLTAGEIIEQVVIAGRFTTVRNVVFMGQGEPLNNYENMKTAVLFLTNDKLLALSPRHITVSTVGVVMAMKRLTQEMPAVNLALSLHAPSQEVRLKIVPAAAANHIDKLMAAVDAHVAASPFARASEETAASHAKRRVAVMIEYILIKDVNDRPEHAHQLGRLLSVRRGHILLNLIPYNPTEVAEAYEAPSAERIDAFYDVCVSAPHLILTRIRREMGQDIAGACGQLALKHPGPAVSAGVAEGADDVSPVLLCCRFRVNCV